MSRRVVQALMAWMAAWALVCGVASAQIRVLDTTGATVTLAAPAKRIIALSPHLTELVYAAGAGAYLVGVSEYSDLPPDAAKLPTVSNFAGINVERVAALKPDLVLVWQSGTRPEWIVQLRKLGIPVFSDEPKSFDDIAATIDTLGTLAGTQTTANIAALAARARAAGLRKAYAAKSPVRVFYQISETPLLTINRQHFLSQALSLCGAVNVFGDLAPYVPQVSREAVLAANPDAIIGGTDAMRSDKSLAFWRSIKSLRAVQDSSVFAVDGTRLHRQTPRALDETVYLCEAIDRVRGKAR